MTNEEHKVIEELALEFENPFAAVRWLRDESYRDGNQGSSIGECIQWARNLIHSNPNSVLALSAAENTLWTKK